MSSAEHWDAAVRHSLAYGAMAHDDPMTTMVTEVALGCDWPGTPGPGACSGNGAANHPAAPSSALRCVLWLLPRCGLLALVLVAAQVS